jgi:hypothetical protein
MDVNRANAPSVAIIAGCTGLGNRQLLSEHHRTIPATTLRFTTANALTEFVSRDQPEPRCSRVSDRLANPSLTCLSVPSSP